MKIFYLLLTFLLSTHVSGQGIMFQCADTQGSSKTIYTVFNKDVPKFNDWFSVEFDIEIYDYHTVGSILRVQNVGADPQGDNYIFAYSYCDETLSYFKFNIETKESRIADTVEHRVLGPGRWHPVSIDFHLTGDSVVVRIGNVKHVTHSLGLPSVMRPHITFGSTKFSERFAGFSIRNLVVKNSAKEYRFPLNESSGESVHNSDKKIYGKVENGKWLINDSYYWRKRFKYNSQSTAAINFDPLRSEMIIVNHDSLIKYTAYNNLSQSIALPQKMPVGAILGTNFYDPQSQQIYIYEVNNLPVYALMAAKLDLTNLSWTELTHNHLQTQRHHHVGIFDRNNSAYTIFGGFGNRQYSKEFVRYNISSGEWQVEQFSGDVLYPRFASGLGVIDADQVLIYGGVGNTSGDESVGVVYYDDLYKVDLKNKKVTRLWEGKSGYNAQVPCRNIIIAPDNKHFYALCYPIMEPKTHVKLYKISIQDGTREQLGDSIPVSSTSILTNLNLYYSNDRSEFYCVIQEFDDNGKSGITIYSINSSLVAFSALNYYSATDNNAILFTILLVIVFVVTITATLVRRYRRNNNIETQINDENDDFQTIPTFSATKNAVYLFGEFRVYDRLGNNTTHLFSNKIRQLFVLILLNSVDGGHGIMSDMINELLWEDKDNQSAKNIKGVTMNRLRHILEDVDGADVVYEDNCFRINVGSEFFCDYFEYLKYWKIVDNVHTTSTQTINDFTHIIARGKFLLGFDKECFDRFKSHFEESVLATLPLQIADIFKIKHDYSKVIGLVSVLTAVDPYSEVALRYELHSLVKQNKGDKAKKRYYQFKVAYLKNMGEDFGMSYNEIIEEDPDSVFN